MCIELCMHSVQRPIFPIARILEFCERLYVKSKNSMEKGVRL